MFLSFTIIAQNEVELVEEKTDAGIVLKGVNHSDQDIELILKITSAGFGLKKEETLVKNIAASSTLEIITLVPTPNRKCTYSVNMSYTTKREAIANNKNALDSKKETPIKQPHNPAAKKKSTNESAPVSQKKENPLAGKKGIVVYSKQNCGRCDFVTKYLTDNNIPFTDLNITTDKEADAQMGKVLFANGFKGGSFTTPLITVDEEVHYNIKDLRGFCEKLK